MFTRHLARLPARLLHRPLGTDACSATNAGPCASVGSSRPAFVSSQCSQQHPNGSQASFAMMAPGVKVHSSQTRAVLANQKWCPLAAAAGATTFASTPVSAAAAAIATPLISARNPGSNSVKVPPPTSSSAALFGTTSSAAAAAAAAAASGQGSSTTVPPFIRSIHLDALDLVTTASSAAAVGTLTVLPAVGSSPTPSVVSEEQLTLSSVSSSSQCSTCSGSSRSVCSTCGEALSATCSTCSGSSYYSSAYYNSRRSAESASSAPSDCSCSECRIASLGKFEPTRQLSIASVISGPEPESSSTKSGSSGLSGSSSPSTSSSRSSSSSSSVSSSMSTASYSPSSTATRVVTSPVTSPLFLSPPAVSLRALGASMAATMASSSSASSSTTNVNGLPLDSAGMIEESHFHPLVDEALEQMHDSLMDLGEDQLPDYDIELASGVLTFDLGESKGIYVINKQTPNRQIWLSSPISGPKRYDYDSERKAWINTRDGHDLASLLDVEIAKLAGTSPEIAKRLAGNE